MTVDDGYALSALPSGSTVITSGRHEGMASRRGSGPVISSEQMSGYWQCVQEMNEHFFDLTKFFNSSLMTSPNLYSPKGDKALHRQCLDLGVQSRTDRGRLAIQRQRRAHQTEASIPKN